MTNDIWKMREKEREIEENRLCASKVQNRIFERRRIFLSFHPRCFRCFQSKANCSCNASNPATSSNMGLYESNARRVYMCGCVCVGGGSEEGIFTDIRYICISVFPRIFEWYIMYYVLSRRGHSSGHAIRKRGKRENDREGGKRRTIYRTERKSKN